MPYSHRPNTRVRLVGYLEASNAAVHTEQMRTVTARNLARSVSQIPQWYPAAEKIYLVWDCWPVHSHPQVKAALSKDPRLCVLPLPTYAPWLNPVEKLWRWARQTMTHAHPWSDDFQEFCEQLRTQFATLSQGSHELLRYVGLST
jgi:transposase